MSADEPAPPDISGDYVERFEWDHANTLFTRYTIGQSGTRVTLKLTREEWLGVPHVHFEGSGVIEKVYTDRPLVRLRFEDGARHYFDLKARRLVADAEELGLRVAMPGLDFHDEGRVRGILHVLDAMAAVVDPAATSFAGSYGNTCWPTATENADDRQYTFTVGPTAGPHYRFSLRYFRDGRTNGCQVKFAGLHDGQSVALNYLGDEVIFYGALCLPEHHAALEEVVRRRCVLTSTWTGRF